jgi:hypothetical protein
MKRTFRLRLAIPVITLACLFLLAAGGSAQDKSIHLEQDFRNAQFNEQHFRYYGENAKEHVKPSAEGLRITVGENSVAGITTRYRIEGDFTFTITYRVHIERPTKGSLAGLEIYAPLDAPLKPAVTFFREARKVTGELFSTGFLVNDETGKRKPSQIKTFPVGSSAGKMRLQRKGGVFILSIADEGSSEFRELHQWKEVGNAPLPYLRVAGIVRNSDGSIDATIESLTLYTDDTQAATVAEEQEPDDQTWLWVVGGFIGLGIAMACGAWLWTRRGKNQDEEEDEEEEEEDKEDAS